MFLLIIAIKCKSRFKQSFLHLTKCVLQNHSRLFYLKKIKKKLVYTLLLNENKKRNSKNLVLRPAAQKKIHLVIESNTTGYFLKSCSGKLKYLITVNNTFQMFF